MITLRRPRNTPHRPRAHTRCGVLVASLLLALTAAPAVALANGTQVVRDCAQDGKLDKTYSAQDYADALKHIPTDVDEYTSCRDVIRRGQLGLAGPHDNGSSGSGAAGGAGGGTSSGGTGASGSGTAINSYDRILSGATAKEREAFQKATTAGAPVRIAGRDLRPDTLGHGELSTLNSLPTPFVIVLALLALGAVAAAVPPIRTFVRTRIQRIA